MTHPVISAIGQTPSGQRVIWHLQTMPNPHAGIETGAWIVDAGSPEETNLLTDTVALEAADFPAAVVAVRAAYDEILAVAAEHPKETAPTLPAFIEPDLAELADAYRGEEGARDTWALGQGLRALIELWHRMEGSRRKRKYLRSALGEEVRPFPHGKNR